MLTHALAFLLGTTLLFQVRDLPSIAWCGLLPLLLTIYFILPRLRLLCIVCTGFILALGQANLILDDALPEAFKKQDLIIVGSIISLPQARKRKTLRFHFKPHLLVSPKLSIQLPKKLALTWYNSAPPLSVGDIWRLSVRVKRPHGFMNPGTFDYEKWLFRHAIRGVGYVRQWEGNKRIGNAGYYMQRMRQAVSKSLDSVLIKTQFSGVIKALAMGQRDGISAEQWRLLRRTGTNHLVAISGLHIGLIAGFGFFLGRKLWSFSTALTKYCPAPNAAAIFSFLVALLYATLAGLSVPTQRALIMVSLVMSAIMLARKVQSKQVIAIALILILLYDPMTVLDPGFWLSFLAVGTILLASYGRIFSHRGITLIWIQLAITLGLLPFLIIFFHQISLIAPLANLFAVPYVSLLVVPLVFLGLILLPVSISLSQLIFTLADRLISWGWDFLYILGDLPFATWNFPELPQWTLAAAIVGVLLLLLPRGIPARWLGFVLLIPLLLIRPRQPVEDTIWFTQLDVGQGLATVIRTKQHVLVYDTGAYFSDRFNAGDAVIVPYLEQSNIQQLDRLIISHADNDHIGGARAVTTKYPNTTILSGMPQAVTWHHATKCNDLQAWDWNGVNFNILYPPENSSIDGNNSSCVIKITSRKLTVLLVGDIETAAEKYLLKNYPNGTLQADILVAPHHGSKTSSTPAFVRAVSPKYVIFPSGYLNKFGHPHSRVIDRYQQIGTILLNTSHVGAIMLHENQQDKILKPVLWRSHSRHFWNNAVVCDYSCVD